MSDQEKNCAAIPEFLSLLSLAQMTVSSADLAPAQRITLLQQGEGSQCAKLSADQLIAYGAVDNAGYATSVSSKHLVGHLHTTTMPATPPRISIEQALDRLKQAMQEDPDYAWGWHCNIAVPLQDDVAKLNHEVANQAATALMRHLFDVDMRQNEVWQQEEAQRARVVDKLTLYEEPAKEPQSGLGLFTVKSMPNR